MGRWMGGVGCRRARFANPNVPLWHNDYIELVVSKKQQTQEKLRKWSTSYPFVRDTRIREVFICSIFPHQEEGDNKISKTLIHGEGKNLDLHYHPHLCSPCFSRSPPITGLSRPPNIFLLSLSEEGTEGGHLAHLRELFSFPIYLPCMQEEYQFLNFCLFSPVNLSFHHRVSGRNLERWGVINFPPLQGLS